MVAAGGCPFREYGMGDSLEQGVQMQLSMALNHGIVFDFVPVTFSDFNSHIVSLGVGVACALLAKLRARESGRVKMDGVMFACKGTLAAALAARAFVEEADGDSRLALMGLGTDLTQGFEDMDEETAKACRARLNIVAMNSLQDTNVGHGDATVTSLQARAARAGGTAVFVDVEARLQEFGKFGNPEHGWYPAAFRRKCCSAVKATILDELGTLVGASPCDVTATGSASEDGREAALPAPPVPTPPVSAAEKLSRRVDYDGPARSRQGPLMLNGLLKQAGQLNHVETKVTLLKDFVGNEMFVAE
mmetsp:Transcript_36239/g.62748  ORF Transcript_36239/g.62748 Transcript_36239/m.62748 type:complete len:304 (+) Transcript_36239:662-1573(+)